MTVKAQIINMVDYVPTQDLPILLEIIRRFVPEERDEYATKDDLHMHKIAMEELQRGETVPHGSVDWS